MNVTSGYMIYLLKNCKPCAHQYNACTLLINTGSCFVVVQCLHPITQFQFFSLHVYLAQVTSVEAVPLLLCSCHCCMIYNKGYVFALRITSDVLHFSRLKRNKKPSLIRYSSYGKYTLKMCICQWILVVEFYIELLHTCLWVVMYKKRARRPDNVRRGNSR